MTMTVINPVYSRIISGSARRGSFGSDLEDVPEQWHGSGWILKHQLDAGRQPQRRPSHQLLPDSQSLVYRPELRAEFNRQVPVAISLCVPCQLFEISTRF
jgi:hypothetical protein